MLRLFLVKRLVHCYRATFTHLDRSLRLLKSIQPQSHGVQPGRDLHASGRQLPRRGSVHDDFRAFRIGVHLRPGHPARGFFAKRHIELRLDIVLDLNPSGVRVIALQAQDKVVLAGRERKRYRRLTRLFRSVDEDIGSRRLAADKNAFGQ